MPLAIIAIVVGLVLLVWSADRFVDGAAAVARYAGMPSLLVGMLVVGFGTSAPEMVVSVMAALEGNSGLALGNALGSNIVNTGLILGVVAILSEKLNPIRVNSKIIRRELPLLLVIGGIVGVMLGNGALSRVESMMLLVGFFALIGWTIYDGYKGAGAVDSKAADLAGLETVGQACASKTISPLPLTMTAGRAWFWLVMGLVILIASARLLVWGAVTVAQALGVSDLMIGLTIVALGTSLPELAASVVAVRRGEHDIAIGNVVGSNMFNLLAVVGLAGVIGPIAEVPSAVMIRDWPVMMSLTLGLLVMAYGFKNRGQLNRMDGTLLVLAFGAYNLWLGSVVY